MRKKMIKISSRYEHPVSEKITEWGPGKTQQHFAHEVNMHEIIERSKNNFPERRITNQQAPIFGDFSNIVDYQSAYEALAVSEEAFMNLNPEIRYRFGNDPAELLTFITQEENRAEAIKLGLIEAPVEAPKGLTDEKKGQEGRKDQLPT